MTHGSNRGNELNENTIHTDKDGDEILLLPSNTVHVMLDSVPFTVKPVGYQRGAVSNRLEKGATEIEVDALANRVGNQGYAFVPALLDGQLEL